MENHSKIHSQLTKEQHEQLIKASALFNCDDKTKHIAHQFLIEYKQHSHNIPNQKISLLAKCAFFLAQKSQFVNNLKGQRIFGIGLSLNQIIKNYSNIDEFVLTLKDFVRRVRFSDPLIQNQISNIVKKISFGITFYTKFQKTLRKIEFVQKVGESYGYMKTFTSFIWLLFIDARSRIYNNSQDLIQNTCLLVSVFYCAIRYSLEFVRPLFLGDPEKQQKQKKGLIAQITQKLLEIFSIQDYQTYKNVGSGFDDYFQKLVQSNIIKQSYQNTDFFSPELININYKRLDSFYQKYLTSDTLDQRLFLRERITNLTPSKITPFGRQGYNNKVFKFEKKMQNKNGMENQNPNKQFTSHRVLNYEINQRDPVQIQKTPSSNELKFPKNVMFSPSLTKTPLICATPLTLGMEMYNYLNQKTKKRKQINFKSKKFDATATKIIERIVMQERKENIESIQQMKTRQIRFNLIYSLYKIAMEQFLSLNCDKQSEQIHQSFIALSTEIVCFVCNVTNLNFTEITHLLDVEFMDLWRATEFFLNFDKSMPAQIKSRLIDIQSQLVAYDCWKNDTMIEFIKKFSHGKCQYENKSEIEFKERFVKRIFNHTASQITSLLNAFKIEDRLKQNVLTILKYIFAYKTQILQKRHLDQMILCAFYAVCKSAKNGIMFNDIKAKYQEINLSNKTMHNEIIRNIYASENSRIDIIQFYNTIFVPELKDFITTMKEEYLQIISRSNYFKNTVSLFQANLKQLIPKDFYQAFKRVNKVVNPLNQPSKEEFASIPLKIQSKKMINFDENGSTTRHRTNESLERDESSEFFNKFKHKNLKTEKQINNTPRINSYNNMLFNSNICETEKIKFKDK